MLNIFLLSDLDYVKNLTHISKIEKITKSMVVGSKNIVILAGDLTDHGYNGVVNFGIFRKCLGNDNCITGVTETNELGMLKTDFVQPMRDMGCELYMVHGNHDICDVNKCYPVEDYMRQTYGDTHYMRVINGMFFLL